MYPHLRARKSSISNLKSLVRHSDIDYPVSVKSEIARRDVTNGARAGSQRRILIPLYMAVIAENATTAMICTA
jgi:hypothetical protein